MIVVVIATPAAHTTLTVPLTIGEPTAATPLKTGAKPFKAAPGVCATSPPTPHEANIAPKNNAVIFRLNIRVNSMRFMLAASLGICGYAND